MSRTVTIAPVSRIEGHARIVIRMTDDEQVLTARLLVEEFRGFESFCIGRPYWEMPAITSRICGICPVSHSLAASRAGELIMGVEPSPAVVLQRRILSLAQLLLSHSLNFFFLSAPDIVLGLDSDPSERNITGLARHCPDIIRKGVRLRQIAQEIVNRIGGGTLQPRRVTAGGMREPLLAEDRDAAAALLPELLGLVRDSAWIWEEHRQRFLEAMGPADEEMGLSLGLVDSCGVLDHLDGSLRFSTPAGTVAGEFEPQQYGDAISEAGVDGSYMKETVCRLGGDGIYRVGPLARLHVAPLPSAPQAEQVRLCFLEEPLAATPLGSHQARLIEMLYAAERLPALLAAPDLCSDSVAPSGEVRNREGVGVTEAPRGTVIHHYEVDRHGLLTRVNLLIATGHNTRAINRTITAIARTHLTGGRLSEGLLNRVEHGVRLYDPCLSCATHTHGRSGLMVELFSPDGKVLDRVCH